MISLLDAFKIAEATVNSELPKMSIIELSDSFIADYYTGVSGDTAEEFYRISKTDGAVTDYSFGELIEAMKGLSDDEFDKTMSGYTREELQEMKEKRAS